MFRPVLSIFLSILLIISVTAAEDIESSNHAESTTYSNEMWKKLHPDIKWNSKHANNVHVGGWGNLGDDNSKLIPNKDANAEYLSTENIKSGNHAETSTYSNEMWKKLHPDIKHANNMHVGGWGNLGDDNSNLMPNKNANAEYLSTENIKSGNHAETSTYSNEMWKKLHPDFMWNRKHPNNVPLRGWGADHGVHGDVHNSNLMPNKNANAEYLSSENIKSGNHAESSTYSNEMWKKLHPDIKWNSNQAVGGWGDYSVHNLTVGYKTYQDRLLYSGAITKPYRFFRIVETDVVVHAPYAFIISFIEANATNSRADNAGYANIKAGGIGRRNVTLHLESARNNDLKYFVRVYGR